MYQVRVTTLEAFRRWKDEVSEYDTEESFLESLTGVFSGNNYTAIGTAFHEIVEKGESVVRWSGEIAVVNTDLGPVYFNRNQVDVALAYKSELSGAVHEIRLHKTYRTKYGSVTVTGCADVIHGLILRDIKTKYSPVKEQYYRDSAQWRFYLELFELEDFIFDLFVFEGYEQGYGLNVSSLQVERHDPIPVLRYKGMEEDNADLLTGFLDYIFSNNLQHHIMDKTEYTLSKETHPTISLQPCTVQFEQIQEHKTIVADAVSAMSAIEVVTATQVAAVTKSLNEAKKVIKGVEKAVDDMCKPLRDLKKDIDATQKKVKEYGAEVISSLALETKRVEALILEFNRAEQARVERERTICSAFQNEGMAFDGVNFVGFGITLAYAELVKWDNTKLREAIIQIREAKSKANPFEPTPTQAPSQASVAPATVMAPKVKGLTKIRKHEIVDQSLIPAEYWVVDTAKISAAVKQGVNIIPGVRIWEEEQIRQTR